MPSSDRDNGEGDSKKPRVDLQAIPTRQYLDQTVVPIVLQGLSAVAKERPADPLEFLANFLLKNRPATNIDPPTQELQSTSA